MKKKLTLPTKLCKIVSDIGGYSILIYGRKKIGKTTICRHFPNALFFMFERGAKKLSIYKRNVKNWKQFKAYVDLVVEDEFFKTIIVDPVDIAYDMCFDYSCNKMGIEHPGGIKDYGKSWSIIKKEFSAVMGTLMTCGKGVIFISHQKVSKIETRDGDEIDFKTNSMSGQASEIIVGDVDIWANYDYTKNKRTLTILGDENVDAGHRLNEDPKPRLLYTNGKPIKQLDMGDNSSEAYQIFLDAFNNKLEQPKVKVKQKTKGKKKWAKS